MASMMAAASSAAAAAARTYGGGSGGWPRRAVKARRSYLARRNASRAAGVDVASMA